jgi:hypothetical protein
MAWDRRPQRVQGGALAFLPVLSLFRAACVVRLAVADGEGRAGCRALWRGVTAFGVTPYGARGIGEGDGSRGFGPWWGAGATPLLLAFFGGGGAGGGKEAWVLRLRRRITGVVGVGRGGGATESPPPAPPCPRAGGREGQEAGGCGQPPWPM